MHLTKPSIRNLQLNIIIQQPHLLTRLKSRQSNIWTPITPKRITERTVATAADLALYRKVHFRKIITVQLERVERSIGGGAFGSVFGFEFLFHAAGAVFAGASSLSGLGLAFECC
jgi:hypothetical protein